MKKKEKVEFVIQSLKKLYPEIPIPLDHYDPFTLLIAVLRVSSLKSSLCEYIAAA